MKLIQISRFLLLVMSVSLLIAGTQLNTALAGEALDGKTFTIKIKEAGKDDVPRDDELIFKDGTFFTTDFAQFGFNASPYESRARDGATFFVGSGESAKEGLLEWEGQVKGDDISGTAIWTKPHEDMIIYKYEGSLKK